jgi:hypothetical protein
MRKGFVTFTNNVEKYRHLHDVLVRSLLEFTPLEIEVFGINFDYAHPDPRVIPKRINLETEDFWSICYSKIYASLMSEFDKTMHIDSDAVAAPGVVKVFDEFDVESKFIHASKHPWDGPLGFEHQQIMNYVGASVKTQPYVHAASYVFSKNSKDFLSDVWEISQKMQADGVKPVNQDETIFNAMLWKHGVTDCFVDCYDPDPTHFRRLFGISNEPVDKIPTLPIIRPYICHGHKNPEESERYFNEIKIKMKGEL